MGLTLLHGGLGLTVLHGGSYGLGLTVLHGGSYWVNSIAFGVLYSCVQVVYSGGWSNHSAQDLQPSYCIETAIENSDQVSDFILNLKS